MIIYNVFLLLLSVCILYYSIFNYNKNLITKGMLIIISTVGIFATLVKVLEKLYPQNIEVIRAIFRFPIVIGIVLMLSLISINAWKMRKIPEKKYAVYLWFGGLAVSLLIMIYVIMLSLNILS